MAQSAMPRVLVIEDDARTADWLRLYLARDGYDVEVAHDGAAALAGLERRRPDLVLLDLMLPGLDGFALGRAVRTIHDVPVIVVSARTAEVDRLRGFDLGADDYVTKPFSPREVMARVRAVLRRRGRDARLQDVDDVACVGATLRLAAREFDAGGEPVRLTPVECHLLAAFMQAPGLVLSRDRLLARAGRDGVDGSARAIDVHVKNIRRKIGMAEAPFAIETVHGAGYRLRARDAKAQ